MFDQRIVYRHSLTRRHPIHASALTTRSITMEPPPRTTRTAQITTANGPKTYNRCSTASFELAKRCRRWSSKTRWRWLERRRKCECLAAFFTLEGSNLCNCSLDAYEAEVTRVTMFVFGSRMVVPQQELCNGPYLQTHSVRPVSWPSHDPSYSSEVLIGPT